MKTAGNNLSPFLRILCASGKSLSFPCSVKLAVQKKKKDFIFGAIFKQCNGEGPNDTNKSIME